jgi:long-chain acyl-CoA synthetase
LLADLSILKAGGVTVPLHGQLSFAAADELLRHCGAKAATAIGERARAVVAKSEGFWRFSLPRGADAPRSPSSAGDLASVIYTSGTTGEPKGVMLTHGNFLANATAMDEALGPFVPGAAFFNWLPLSHVYARTVDFYLPIVAGGTIVLAESPQTVVRDLSEIHPAHLSSVPRFYEKVLASVSTLSKDEQRLRLRSIFGPRIGWLGCGGAPLADGVAESFRELGFEVIVGYGLTECSPVIATNRLGANRLGTVGQAIPGVDIRIADDGEVLTRGPHVMRGYWNRPADHLSDGWFATGDLGHLDSDGFLTITGRKSEMIVLSTGKKVAPAAIESRLMQSPLIENVIVFGEGRPSLGAIVVLRGPGDATAEIDRLLADRPPWERVRQVIVSPRPFAGDELTVSQKVRRSVVLDNFRQRIDDD